MSSRGQRPESCVEWRTNQVWCVLPGAGLPPLWDPDWGQRQQGFHRPGNLPGQRTSTRWGRRGAHVVVYMLLSFSFDVLLLLFLHHHLKPLFFFYSVLKNKCIRQTFNQYSSAFRLSELLANTSKYIVNNKTNCICETFEVRTLTNCWLYNSLYCLCSLWCMFEFIVSYFTVYCLDSYWKGPKINLQPSVLPPVCLSASTLNHQSAFFFFSLLRLPQCAVEEQV